MICPTSICTGHCPGQMNIMPVPGSDNNKINQMPMSGTWMHPRGLEFVFLPEEGVSDGEFVFYTLGQDENPVGVDVPYTLFPNGASPRSMVPTNSGIEIPQKDDFVFFGYA